MRDHAAHHHLSFLVLPGQLLGVPRFLFKLLLESFLLPLTFLLFLALLTLDVLELLLEAILGIFSDFWRFLHRCFSNRLLCGFCRRLINVSGNCRSLGCFFFASVILILAFLLFIGFSLFLSLVVIFTLSEQVLVEISLFLIN